MRLLLWLVAEEITKYFNKLCTFWSANCFLGIYWNNKSVYKYVSLLSTILIQYSSIEIRYSNYKLYNYIKQLKFELYCSNMYLLYVQVQIGDYVLGMAQVDIFPLIS